MSHAPARFVALIVVLTLTAPPSALHAKSSAPSAPSAPSAAHVLNRLSFGPRPADLERIQRLGVDAWIDEQLHPERLDDRALHQRLSAFQTLSLDASTLFREYHQPAQIERRRLQRERAASGEQAPERGEPAAASERRARVMSPALQKDRQIIAELEQARILRAVYSERQLEEVLVDFWFNHFNVFAGKGPIRTYVTAFERDAIRPHVLGQFRQMLEAVAKSPAMLFYLDNWQSAASGTGRAVRGPATRGLNENYARELLELHTLGVDGGYTQDDIVNVARAFTGWTMRPRQGPEFLFVPALHDRGEKVVLGQRITAGGVGDGQQVLDLLAAHPATARFIAAKLAQKFVSDVPPPALVDRAAQTFTRTGGNLREVTRAIVTSPEFRSPDAYRAKVKTPLEFVASALRATGAEVRTALPLARALRDLGMPLYFCQPPTGYDETADTWVSSGALVSRMNFALDLGANRLRGVTLGAAQTDVASVVDQLVSGVLNGDASDTTRATLARATTPAQAVALAIGSPEFQRQ